MDEYLEDEGDGGEGIGKILVDKDAEMDGQDEDDEDANSDAKKHDSDSDIEDDLEDVPNTREYMPLDVQGLRSLGIGGATGGEGGYTSDDLRNMTDNYVYDDDFEEEEEDEDYLEDVQLRDGDALVVVAKTEEKMRAASSPSNSMEDAKNSIIVLNKVYNVLMDMYGGDNANDEVYAQQDVSGHFTRTLPGFKRSMKKVASTERENGEVGIWNETALNANRFIRFKRGG